MILNLKKKRRSQDSDEGFMQTFQHMEEGGDKIEITGLDILRALRLKKSRRKRPFHFLNI